MEFKADKERFVLTSEEAALFGLPQGTCEWPNTEAGMLLEGVQKLEETVTNMDVTAVSPAERPRMLYTQARRAAIARQARHLIAAHMVVEFSDDDIARLADGEL